MNKYTSRFLVCLSVAFIFESSVFAGVATLEPPVKPVATVVPNPIPMMSQPGVIVTFQAEDGFATQVVDMTDPQTANIVNKLTNEFSDDLQAAQELGLTQSAATQFAFEQTSEFLTSNYTTSSIKLNSLNFPQDIGITTSAGQAAATLLAMCTQASDLMYVAAANNGVETTPWIVDGGTHELLETPIGPVSPNWGDTSDNDSLMTKPGDNEIATHFGPILISKQIYDPSAGGSAIVTESSDQVPYVSSPLPDLPDSTAVGATAPGSSGASDGGSGSGSSPTIANAPTPVLGSGSTDSEFSDLPAITTTGTASTSSEGTASSGYCPPLFSWFCADSGTVSQSGSDDSSGGQAANGGDDGGSTGTSTTTFVSNASQCPTAAVCAISPPIVNYNSSTQTTTWDDGTSTTVDTSGLDPYATTVDVTDQVPDIAPPDENLDASVNNSSQDLSWMPTTSVSDYSGIPAPQDDAEESYASDYENVDAWADMTGSEGIVYE